MCERRRRSRNTVCFHNACGSGGSKSKFAKAAGSEPAGEMRNEKLLADVGRNTFGSENVQRTSASAVLEVGMSKKFTPFWREAYLEVKRYKAPRVPTFGS